MNTDFKDNILIKNIFAKNKVVLAFLFGSTVKGKATKLSDLDIGVVLAKNITVRQYHQIRITLLDQIGRVIKNRPIDLAILNEASPLLVQMVITRGRIIYCQSEFEKIEFQTNALKKFDDTFYLRKTYYHYLGKRVMEDTLGETYGQK